MNTCKSEHEALTKANTRSKEGYIASGTGLVQCARHALVRKNGVGDLQKGEKYAWLRSFLHGADRVMFLQIL